MPIEDQPYAFANLLLSGPCNLRCPDCIGQKLDPDTSINTLSTFPPPGFDTFIKAVREQSILQISITGTNTDPQLYPYEIWLIDRIRNLVDGVQISLHSNGRLALLKPEAFNAYDRATISLPSFDPLTCRLMTGSARVLDLPSIMLMSEILIKISTLITEHNSGQLHEIIDRCRKLGIKRMVLRQRYGEHQFVPAFDVLTPIRQFAGNPVYEVDGIEVTIWNFSRSKLQCLNLFPDGTLSHHYELNHRRSA